MENYNINNFSQLYRCTMKGTGATGEVVRLKLERIRPRILRVLTHVTVENITSAYTKGRLGIDAGGRTHYLDELTGLTDGELAVARADILLGEGDVFFSELTGTTTDDALVMTCVGWEQAL